MKIRKMSAIMLASTVAAATQTVALTTMPAVFAAEAETTEDTSKTDNALTFEENEDGTLTAVYIEDCGVKEVVVPAEHDGKKVTAIDGFKGTEVEKVTLPEGITEIGFLQFGFCYNLKSVNIPSTVTSIGDGAFTTCSVLETITIPKDVTYIGSEAFEYCIALKNIVIPEKVAEIGTAAFRMCDSLTEVTIPESVKTIYELAFYDCENLESVTIEGAETIGEGAFMNCPKLKTVTLPKTLKSVGENAFWSSFEYDPETTEPINVSAECTAKINYEGSEDDWKKIETKTYHTTWNGTEGDYGPFNGAEITYNYTAPTTPDSSSSSSSSSTPAAVPSKNYSDTETNVSVSVPETLADSTLEGTTLAVEQIKNSDESSKDVTYDISFKDKDGKVVSLDKNTVEITVKIPVPEALKDENKLYVYYVDDKGNYTDMKATVKDGNIEFKTTHFSKYLITTDGSLASNSPDTGFGGIAVTLGIVALAGAAVVVAKKKH